MKLAGNAKNSFFVSFLLHDVVCFYPHPARDDNKIGEKRNPFITQIEGELFEQLNEVINLSVINKPLLSAARFIKIPFSFSPIGRTVMGA